MTGATTTTPRTATTRRSPGASRAQTAEALRAGWNDAAWGRPERALHPALAPAYWRGYAGGLAYRRRLIQPTDADLERLAAGAVLGQDRPDPAAAP